MADIFIELHRYLFPLLVSPSNDTTAASRVGGIAHQLLMDFESSKMRTIGPFSSPETYYRSLLQKILDAILQEDMYSRAAVDAYSIHRFLIDLVPSVISPYSQSNDKSFLSKTYR